MGECDDPTTFDDDDPSAGQPPGDSGLDRRQFLKLSARTVAALSVLPQLEFIGSAEAAAARLIRAGRPARTLRATLRRRVDLVELSFDFYNLTPRNAPDGTELVRPAAGSEAWVVVEFPPQHILEEAFLEASSSAQSDPLKAPGTVGARLAAPSRLAFVVPSSVTAIPYDAQGLLSWTWALPIRPSSVWRWRATSRTRWGASNSPRSPEPITLSWLLTGSSTWYEIRREGG